MYPLKIRSLDMFSSERRSNAIIYFALEKCPLFHIRTDLMAFRIRYLQESVKWLPTYWAVGTLSMNIGSGAFPNRVDSALVISPSGRL
ncbi:hypothetical protein BDQ12DRAFT_447968 [Crucibulum laeve]|uniref:Uncharacterized protein n=1 Tax=Crucibulum laeve TaxID=68775 RepID=A0A5C3LJT3_9AGAR|nr:hypothetical protein BDQ12DRAFT_447968 [Crucibulum laeve]